MHILILADAIDNQNAGVHFYTKELIENLLKTDKINKYSFIHCEKNNFFNNTDHYIIPQHHYPGSESYRRFIIIPRLIKKLNPDIVLQPCHIGPFFIPKHIKRAVTIHDLTPVTYKKFHTPRGIIVHKLFLKRTLKNADLILTPSETTASDIKKLYKPKALIKITPLGINKSQKISSISPIHEPYILYLGTIEPRKNLELLVEAFLELKAQNQLPHKLILAGAIGWKSKKLLKKIKNNKEIILTGYLQEDEKAAYYKHADMFVYPSIYEGFGLPPLEVMSYGVPVICSTGGSLKEYFSNHALMFEPKDKETLKRHILSLIKNKELRSRLISDGLSYAKTFTWENTARKTLKAFEEIMK